MQLLWAMLVLLGRNAIGKAVERSWHIIEAGWISVVVRILRNSTTDVVVAARAFTAFGELINAERVVDVMRIGAYRVSLGWRN